MSIRAVKAAVATAVAVTLAITVSPAPAHAVTDDGPPVPISVVLSQSDSLAAVPIRVKNRKSSLYLQASSTANNAIVRQQGASSNLLQAWFLVADSSYTTFWNAGVDRNLGTSGASTASNTSAVIVNGSSSFDQDWLISAIDSTYFQLKNRKNTSMCLGIDGASTAAGARAAIYSCAASAPNQTWNFATF